MSVILPGSYDPVTKGHLDIIRRAAEKYDEVYVVVFTNPKKEYMFSVEDRVRMLMLATDDLDNVLVSYSNGLVIDYMTDHEISKIIKGYRTEEDLEWEREQAEWNYEHGRYETELWKCRDGLEDVSSTAAREAIMENEPLDMLPEKVVEYIENTANEKIKKIDEKIRKALNATDIAPRLKINQFSLTPCRLGVPQAVTAVNYGGEGKGLTIYFIGDYVESGDVTFDDVTFIHHYRDGKFTENQISLEKTMLSDGSLTYCYKDDDFLISPYKASTMKESQECFGIRFKPNGNTRKFLDITVVIAPNENFVDGQCCWYVWAHYPSKRRFVEERNRERFEHLPEEIAKRFIINPEDFDLD
ncbi:MAG: pantetheine-phosphate adenylyltransferase [Clostridia bacterium]|nr:pantetheine-phosphate adenylyltransferase [Clostridia bacterium]